MKFIALVLALLISTPVYADCLEQDYSGKQQPDWDCPAPGEAALVPKLEMPNMTTPLAKEEKAPFAGLLLDKNRAITLGLRITALRHILWTTMDADQKLMDLKVQHERAEAKINLDAVSSERDNYKAQVAQLSAEKVSQSKWYRSWTFGFVLGAGITAASSIALMVALR